MSLFLGGTGAKSSRDIPVCFLVILLVYRTCKDVLLVVWVRVLVRVVDDLLSSSSLSGRNRLGGWPFTSRSDIRPGREPGGTTPETTDPVGRRDLGEEGELVDAAVGRRVERLERVGVRHDDRAAANEACRRMDEGEWDRSELRRAGGMSALGASREGSALRVLKVPSEIQREGCSKSLVVVGRQRGGEARARASVRRAGWVSTTMSDVFKHTNCSSWMITESLPGALERSPCTARSRRPLELEAPRSVRSAPSWPATSYSLANFRYSLCVMRARGRALGPRSGADESPLRRRRKEALSTLA